jgi:hypothetical protein
MCEPLADGDWAVEDRRLAHQSLSVGGDCDPFATLSWMT